MIRLLGGLLFIIVTAAPAAVLLDGSLGPKAQLTGPDFMVQAHLGHQVGGNLFHSFEQFSIHNGESVTFSGPSSIQYIISRVTGAQPSLINGRLHNAIPQADFYLLNPQGIIFGEHARLELQGGFHASSATTLSLGQEGHVAVKQPEQSVLTAAPPTQFGFLTPLSADIKFSHSQLQLAPAQSLTLTARRIELDNSILGARQISLIAQDSIILKNNSVITSQAQTRAQEHFIRLQAPIIQLTHQSYIDSSTLGSYPSGDIHITASEQLLITNQSGISVATGSEASGAAGHIDLETGQFNLRHRSFLNSGTLGSGAGGDISIRAQQGILLTDDSLIASSVGDLFHSSSGNGGNIDITTPQLHLQAHSAIQTGTFGATQGRAGTIHITTEQLSLNQLSTITSSTLGQGQGGHIDIQAADLQLNHSTLSSGSGIGSGRAGDIRLTTERTALSNTSLIATSALRARGGNIVLNVDQQLTVFNSGISARAQSSQADASGGNLTIEWPTFIILNHSELNASAVGGPGGNITLRSDHVLSSTDSRLDASSELGIAGNILIEAPQSELIAKLSHLSTDYLSRRRFIQNRCAERLGEQFNSLTARHYEALPPSPYQLTQGYLPLPHELAPTVNNVPAALSTFSLGCHAFF